MENQLSVPIYYINLDRDVVRAKKIEKLAEQTGWLMHRIAAHSDAEMPKKWRAMLCDENGRPFSPLTPGELGCYASHLTAISKAVELNRPIAVAEDDIELLDIDIDLQLIVDNAPPDWGFIRLSNPLKSPAVKRVHLSGPFDLVEPWRVPNNMGFYLVSPAGAQSFLSYSQKRARANDEDLRRVWEHKAVNYVLAPPLVVINQGKSSIDQEGSRTCLPERQRSAHISDNRRQQIHWLKQRFSLPEKLSILWKWFLVKVLKRSQCWIVRV